MKIELNAATAKDLLAKAVNAVHRTVYDLSKGRVGGDLMAMPVVKLTTMGRKSGERRTTMLTVAHEMDDALVLIASYGGDDRHPNWYLNLVAHPDVEIEIRGESTPMRARVATGDERTRIWSEVIRKHTNYASYQRQTEREIPVIVLEPR